MTQESELVRVGRLEIEHDPQFQAQLWKVQRLGWLFLVVTGAAALLGLLGTGPLSYATARSADGLLSVQYQRFERKHSDTSIAVRVAARGGWDLKLNRELMDAIRIDQIQPEPKEMRVLEDGVSMHFETLPGSDSGEVTFRQQYDKPGKINAVIAFRSSQVAFWQFVYP